MVYPIQDRGPWGPLNVAEVDKAWSLAIRTIEMLPSTELHTAPNKTYWKRNVHVIQSVLTEDPVDSRPNFGTLWMLAVGDNDAGSQHCRYRLKEIQWWPWGLNSSLNPSAMFPTSFPGPGNEVAICDFPWTSWFPGFVPRAIPGPFPKTVSRTSPIFAIFWVSSGFEKKLHNNSVIALFTVGLSELKMAIQRVCTRQSYSMTTDFVAQNPLKFATPVYGSFCVNVPVFLIHLRPSPPPPYFGQFRLGTPHTKKTGRGYRDWTIHLFILRQAFSAITRQVGAGELCMSHISTMAPALPAVPQPISAGKVWQLGNLRFVLFRALAIKKSNTFGGVFRIP